MVNKKAPLQVKQETVEEREKFCLLIPLMILLLLLVAKGLNISLCTGPHKFHSQVWGWRSGWPCTCRPISHPLSSHTLFWVADPRNNI